MVSFSSNDIFLITGASGGIGRAVSQLIVALGGRVIGVARNRERLEETKTLCQFPDNFLVTEKDLSEDIESLPAWITEIVQNNGKLKGLVHCAGVQETLPLQVIKLNQAKKLFDINYFVNLFLIKGFAKKSNNAGAGSSIVCISSFVSQVGLPAISNYSASKGALNSLVKSLAVELSRDGIRINSVLPGHIMTDLITKDKTLSEKFIENLKPKYPLGLGRPEDVANITCFLLSDAARWVTGAEYVIDGGASIMF